MGSASCIERFGGIAVAFGASALMVVCGAGTAVADPRGPSDTDQSASSDDTPSDADSRTARNRAKTIAEQAKSSRHERPVAPGAARRTVPPASAAAPAPTARDLIPEPPAIRPAHATAVPAQPAPLVVAVPVPPEPAPTRRSAATPPLPVARLRVAAPSGVLAAEPGFRFGSGSGPGQPPSSPASWTVLAAVRRELSRPRPVGLAYDPLTTGQPVVPQPAAAKLLNRPPVIKAVTVGAPDPDTGSVTGTVSASDPNAGRIAYRASTSAKGRVTITSTGVFTYTPTPAARHAAAKIGAPVTAKTDTVTVTVANTRRAVTSTTVQVQILPANNAPVATAGTPTLSTDLSTGTVTGSINAADPDGDRLTYTTLNMDTAKGTVAVTNTGNFTYTPSSSARQNAASPTATTADATDSFSVAVTDTCGATSAIAVSVPVVPVSTAPPPVVQTGHMAVGMNLESVVDWSPAWTFTDAFKASRPWISQSLNPQTWQVTWDPARAPTLDVDADGNIRSLKTWTANGVQMKQYAGTLMFDALGGDYAAGTYHAEWDGTGVVTFGFDATVVSSGKTPAGRNYAELKVTPTDNGIYMRIEETSPADPVRNINVWMPDYNGQSFVGQRWQPGAATSPATSPALSPFHPLFLSRLQPFGTLRFMAMQETNGSDITTWSQRRDAKDIRQGSGAEGTPSEPLANGISVEYMVELANELDADPWFNMPYAADDTFVRNFATYVSEHLEPGRTVYVEWANEVWNFGWGFEASQWVADKAKTAGLDPDYGQWIVAGQEAKRDMDIWSQVFAGQSSLHLVRVAAGWAAVDWVTNQIAENMGGAFDAIAIAPYITPTDEQRAGYTGSTAVDTILADTRRNIATSVQWTANHEQLAKDWSAKLGRPIELLAYEGGPHLDGRGAAYQNAFYAAANDARMGAIYRDYLKALDSAGMDLYLDFQFTGQAGAAPWGDFAKLHGMNQSLATAYRYNAVVAGADGTLWPAV